MEWGSLLKATFALGAGMVVLGWALRDRLPGPEALVEAFAEDPMQEPLDAPMTDFQVRAGDVTYTIHPLYRYELAGLVVSQHDARVWYNITHRGWGDFLNVKDLCIVWGANLATGVYQQVKFRSESFTCYYEFAPGTDQSIWRQFRPDQISNNHLLPSTPEVRRALLSVQRGDQVRIAGYLCEYSHGGGFRRGTSTVRSDDGNGACETIFVESITVLRPANRLWHGSFRLGWVLMGGSVVLGIVGSVLDARRRVQELEAAEVHSAILLMPEVPLDPEDSRREG